jgi:hypothetical protein
MKREVARGLAGFVTAVLLAVTTGCTTSASANARARAAYLAGRQSGLAVAAQGPIVQVVGDVQNHVIPWTEDLTLIQALVAAEYKGLGDPSQISVIRDNQQIDVNTQALLRGKQDMPLEAGDRINIRP